VFAINCCFILHKTNILVSLNICKGGHEYLSTITITHKISSIGRKELDRAIKNTTIRDTILNLWNDRSSVDTLLDYLKTSHDFPDNELADNVEKAHIEFRKNFRLQSSS
jgi:hypothetical protein